MNKIEDRILRQVEKPVRYTGGELNSVIKDKDKVKCRLAYCFPDTYEIGMSHLGIKILYGLANLREDTWCERVFAPAVDLEKILRKENIPLFALESKDPLNVFDMLGFTLQYELSYTNILNMLDLAGIPPLAEERTEEMPLIFAGGPCAYNPEPLAYVMDFFVMGEGEEVNDEIIDKYIEFKEQGKTKKEFLIEIAKIEGVYVPSLYEEEYSKGEYVGLKPLHANAKRKISKRIIKDLNTVYYPDKFVVPFTDTVHDRVMLEVFRGCIRGCRFCQAGYIYRPVRMKSAEVLRKQANKLIENTGYEEISLSSLSTSDYAEFEELASNLISDMEKKRVNLSLPSLRIDSISKELLEKIKMVRKSGLTLAPEAGSQRLRDVINKGITIDNILTSCRLAFEEGFSNVKLYFMIGLPTETYQDLDGIVDIAFAILDEYYKVPKGKRGKGIKVTVSTSTFVPKPFTPFMWCRQDTLEEIQKKQEYLKEKLKDRRISYSWHDSKTSRLEAAISRGDRKTGRAIYEAWKLGCKFDAWGEYFNYETWLKAFEKAGVDIGEYTNTELKLGKVLPWEHINVFVSKKFLHSEYKKALEGKITENCKANCAGCGITILKGGPCFE